MSKHRTVANAILCIGVVAALTLGLTSGLGWAASIFLGLAPAEIVASVIIGLCGDR